MGRRKRKQSTYKRVKRVPKIFNCPSCGEKSVKVEKTKKTTEVPQEDGSIKEIALATVKCGYCGESKEVLLYSIGEPVDAFGDFIDIYYVDQELQRLEKRIEKLMTDKEFGELALTYSILSDLCNAKAMILMDDAENFDEEVYHNWRKKAMDYKRKEKDALLKLESEELERGIKTDDESLFAEHEEGGGIKKERKIEDIFEDPGFLEF